jgi:hypothetical protein
MSSAALAREVKPSAGGWGPTPLRVNTPGDAYEREADRAAEQVVSGKRSRAGWPLSKISMQAPLQRVADGSGTSSALAPDAVHDVLRGEGRPLEPGTRSLMESRFGFDFSGVRIFNDSSAARSAGAVSAHAYTVGKKIVFDQGRYAPQSPSGRRLLAHELAHVVQQEFASPSSAARLPMGEPGSAHELAADRAANASMLDSPSPDGGQRAGALARANRLHGPVVQRLSYAEAKEATYKALVFAARKTTQVSIGLLRTLASKLPSSMQSGASTLIDIADFIIGADFAVVLAVIGMIVGAGEGVADMVEGLVTMVLGIGKVLYDAIWGLFTNFNALEQDWDKVVDVFKGLPSAVKALVKDWLDRFEKAPSERQSLMIGELTGQIIALIGTFAISAGRAGTAAKAGSEGADLAAAAAKAAEAAKAADAAAAAAKITADAAKAADATAAAAKAADAAKVADAAETAAKAAKAPRAGLRALQGGGNTTPARATTATRAAAAARAGGGGSVGSAGGRATALAEAVAPETEEAPKIVLRAVPDPVAPAPAPVVPAPVPVVPAPAPVVVPGVPATPGPGLGRAIAAGAVETVAKGTQIATGPSAAPVPSPQPGPQPLPDPKDKKKTRPPFVLNLPRQKAIHLPRYRGLLGQLESDPNYDRGSPAQRDEWDKNLRIGGSHAISQEIYEKGHALGLTGEKGEELIRIPNWTPTGARSPMEVDHIIELQVTPPPREYYDHIDFYELLDRSANGNSGNVLRANIAEERAKQVAFDPTAANRVLKFDAVGIKGGINGERWTLDEIQAGEQLDAYKK